MQTIFGSGNIWATQTSDAFGNSIAVPTPVKFGVLQDISVEFSGDIKELYGQSQYPVDVARGKGKIAIKAKNAQINAALFNSLFFGQTLTTNQIMDYSDVTGAAVPATPFTITPTPPLSGVWSKDLGVRNANGNPLTKVASAPTTGQYSVTAGAYLFAAADTGTTVYIDYQYTLATLGKTAIIANPLMGIGPTFGLDISVPGKSKGQIWTFPNCVSTKLSFATKLDDYAIPEFDISAYANAAGQVVTFSTLE